MRTFIITAKNRKWWVLAAMISCVSVIFLDQSVLPVALPTVQRDLALSEVGLQWTVNIYLLVLTAFVLAGGRVGDMFGHRKIFILGLVIFALASALCGFSQNSFMFIASRGLQGIGGALMIPTGPALLTPAFPAEQRGKIFGLYISIGAFFLALGPLIGGFLTEYFSWRYVFWINLPIAALGLFLTFLSVPKSQKIKETFDYIGFFTLVLGTTGIITALMQGKDWGWSSWPIISLGTAGLILLALLVVLDRKVSHPFIDFSLFRKHSFNIGNFCIICTQFILMLTVFWAIYFQKILGYTPLLSGVWSMIASCPVIILGSLSGHLFDRYGAKLPIMLGFFLVSFALLWFTLVPLPKSSWQLLPVVLPFGCGIPLILIPSFTLYLDVVEANKRGAAVGISSTLRQFGATAGMAIFGSYFLHKEESSLQKLLSSQSETANLDPMSFAGLISHAEPAITALQKLPPSTVEQVQSSVFTSTVAASTSLNLLGLYITLVALIIAAILLRRGKLKQTRK